MMKFTMNAKELKEMMDKGLTAIDKKASLESLRKLYFQVDEQKTLRIIGTNLEHFVEVTTKNTFNTSPGVTGIDIDDIKVLSKMSGEITVEDVSTSTKTQIDIRCGKKTLTIPKYGNTDVFLPSMDDTESDILCMKENWLLETILNLNNFVLCNEKNKITDVFNFNTKEKRVEALDGHRIGTRTLEDQNILCEQLNPFNDIKLHCMCIPVFKKLMNKKSEKDVVISQDKKYIKVKGERFTYVTRRIDIEYPSVSKFLNFTCDFTFIPDREQFLEVMTYDVSLLKGTCENRKPVVFHTENGKLYAYMITERYEVLDELNTKVNTMNDNMYIGFNPKYLEDIFKVVDCENPVCSGVNPKTGMMIKGNEYVFYVLPINLNFANNKEDFVAFFSKKLKIEVA